MLAADRVYTFPVAVTLKVGGALWQLLMQLIAVRGHTNLIFLLILKCFADFQKVKGYWMQMGGSLINTLGGK